MLGPAPDDIEELDGLAFLWEEYVQADPATLTRDAQELAERVRRRVYEITGMSQLLEAAETALETLRQCCKAGMEDDTDSICGGDCRFCDIHAAKEKLEAAIAKAEGRDAGERGAD